MCLALLGAGERLAWNVDRHGYRLACLKDFLGNLVFSFSYSCCGCKEALSAVALMGMLAYWCIFSETNTSSNNCQFQRKRIFHTIFLKAETISVSFVAHCLIEMFSWIMAMSTYSSLNSATSHQNQILAFNNNSLQQSSYLIFLTMIYLTVMLCSGVLTHRIIQLGSFYTMAGTLVAPLWFTLSDIIAEIYGYRIARKIVWFGFGCQAMFAIACYAIIQIPSPEFINNQIAYSTVLGSMLQTCISAFVAYIIAGFINIYLISRWKILWNGRFFWLRSLGSSTISELIFTVIAVSLIQYDKLPLSKIITIIAVSYSLKIIYAVILAAPANYISLMIKKADEIDVYDFGVNYNPFRLAD